MTKQNRSSLEKYEGAQVAQQFIRAGDLNRANIALLRTPIDSDGKLLLEGDKHYSTPEGIKTASEIYGNEFARGLNASTFGELKDFYRGAMSELSGNARKKVETLFDKYSDKKLEDVQTAYLDAIKILENPEGFKREISQYVSADKLDETVQQRIKQSKDIKAKYGSILTFKELLQESRNMPIERSVRNSFLERLVQEPAELAEN